MVYKNIFIDLDGVILNSEEMIIQEKEKFLDMSWDDFFERLDWKHLLENCDSINGSVELIRNLQELRSDIAILTKIHTVNEMQFKILEMRNNRGIFIPILFVPPHIRKSEIINPKDGKTLIDDSKKNIDDWINHGGNGILFDTSAIVETKQRVRSLNFLKGDK